MADSDKFPDLKADLRRAAMARRDALSPAERIAAAQAIAERGLPVDAKPGAIVSGFSPLRSEISPFRVAPIDVKAASRARFEARFRRRSDNL